MPQQQQQQQPLEEAAAVPLSPTGEQGTPLLPGSRLRGPQPPPVNPLQFIKISPPVNLYKPPPPREIPPVVEQIRKEEPEDWQNDLEGWKVNRRKRQEQLMERVSEIKKMEEEQSNSASRRNKTFSEMMRGRKCSIVVYNEGNENDLSELGIGNKSQEEEEEEENETNEEENKALENEFTFEKAIQNYVEFASSRVCKPVMSAGSVSNDIDMTSIISSTQTTETDSWNNTSLQDKVSKNLVDQYTSSPEKKQEQQTQYSGARINEYPVEEKIEKSSLLEKISVFEKPLEIISPKKIDSKFRENVPIMPAKKLRPPVPSKPKVINRDEAPSVSFFQATSMAAPLRDTWNSVNETITDSSVMQKTSEVAFINSSSGSSSELRLHPSVSHTKELEPNYALLDDLVNQDIELSPTASSAEVPVCESSMKLIEAPVLSSSLDHVSPRDIQRSPLGGEDSGVHTADSVSQSDEVEEEEMPSLVDLEMPTGLLSILSSQGPIIDHELSALLAAPSRLEPPREKPPPPPPACLEPDMEIMRKSFLGLEFAAVSQAAVVAVAAPENLSGAGDSLEADCLGTQLKERLLKLEEEKNNILNLEKHLKAEKLPPHPTETRLASKESAGTQESLAVEREALRIEREVISTIKQASFAKKLAVRSLESLDIPPLHDNDGSNENEGRIYNGNGSSTINNAIPKKKHNFKKSEDETYIAQSLEKDNMPHYYHSPIKQHSIDELPTAYETVTNEISTENHNYNLPIRKSQSEDQLSSDQNVQQPYPSPPKQNISNRHQSHQSHEQSFQKQYQPKQQENNYQPNVYQKHSPEQPPLQQYYTPPSPRYLDHTANNNHYYEDSQSSYFEPQPCETASMHTTLTASQGTWNNQSNYIPQAVAIRKKGPPPPLKPSRIIQQQHHLTRNYSADSILESVDGDPPVALRRSTGNSSAGSGGGAGGGRSAMHYSLGGSMSQLPSHSSQQPRARPTSNQGINYQHWLVQEAEHRRITEQQQRQAAANPRQPKHLPDAIIMSLTQRVQQRQSQIPQRTSPQRNSVEDKVLSVSGKKKCSHCNLELGRGAAMIIESLRLFYHIDCFKCCVCCIQLGDGLMGTDVRVRNGKLHCHSCYSSDDGVKFSCV